MAKKQHERSEVEVLRARNKKLEKENKDLRRDLGRKEKREHLYTDLEERTQEEEIRKEKNIEVPKEKKLCPKCNKGLNVVDLGLRKLTTCSNCSYRKSEK